MSIFKITSTSSVIQTVPGFPAFISDTAGPDTLIVESGGFLITAGSNTRSGAELLPTGAWTVLVNGTVFGANGIFLLPGNAAISTITVGADGSVGSGPQGSGVGFGIAASSSATIKNAGTITGQDVAIAIFGGATHTIVNTGEIEAQGGEAIWDLSAGVASKDTVKNAKAAIIFGNVFLDQGDDTLINAGEIIGTLGAPNAVELGSGHNTLTNTGTIFGHILGGSGKDIVTSSGLIQGNVSLDAGNDVFTNTGRMIGKFDAKEGSSFIDLGDGNDKFTGGRFVETVGDGNGTDKVTLGAGNDFYNATGAAGSDGIDSIDGGDGRDTYIAFPSTSSVQINLDTVAHAFSPFIQVAANTAIGLNVAGAGHDHITGFENAIGGQNSDLIYGSSAANHLEGRAGGDELFGFGGRDHLSGEEDGDLLVGGGGADTLDGGTGSDTFLLVSITDSGTTMATRDTITDFRHSDGDKINLNFIDANSTNGAATNDAFHFIGTNVNWDNSGAGQLRAYWTATGQIIEGDVDGDHQADLSIFLEDPGHIISLSSVDGVDFFL